MTYNLNLHIPTDLTKIESNFLHQKQVELFIKRDDMIHNVISGNKWRKLKYNLQAAKSNGDNTILSYGGAYSNHLHALSYACRQMGFNSIGIVRGVKDQEKNSTLSFCKENNMRLYYLDRSSYRLNKNSKNILRELNQNINQCYMLPEGGNNILGVKGCEEILLETDNKYDYVCCPVGTGCTAAGLIRTMSAHTKFLGFGPFKKVFEQKQNIKQLCNSKSYDNWDVIADDHFGGFGRIDDNLIKFVQKFKLDYNVELDMIYMGKLFYSLFKLIEQDFFSQNTKILILHTGGLQGLKGFNFSYS